ncbi:CLUMA_CG000486, isoform A [Clunio marinus]|uniref:CLUMA_CG000486, isoform A n=1 Tax=Clunio marinus TaxID=568069 RepID=A0A1J1HGH5_9DIPT|nr:CLUMA_CG000486, isoform A [Clunio marinus]
MTFNEKRCRIDIKEAIYTTFCECSFSFVKIRKHTERKPNLLEQHIVNVYEENWKHKQIISSET